MVGATNSNVLQQQLEEVIDDELRKLEFASLCKQIALKVVDRVQKIDNDHNEIKALYGELEQQVARYVSDRENPNPTPTPTNNDSSGRGGRNSGNIRNSINKDAAAAVILIDDDDDDVDISVSTTNGVLEATTEEVSSTTAGSASIVIAAGSLVPALPQGNLTHMQMNGHVNNIGIRQNAPLVNGHGPAPPNSQQYKRIQIEDTASGLGIDSSQNIDVTSTAADISEPGSQSTSEQPLTDSQFSDTTQDENTASSQYSTTTLGDSDSNTASQCSTINSTQSSAITAADDTTDNDPSSSTHLSVLPTGSVPPSNPPIIMKITTEKSEKAEASQYSITVVSPVEKDAPKAKSILSAETAVSGALSPNNPPNVLASPSSQNIPRRKKQFEFKANSLVYAKPIESDIWYEAELLKEVPGVGKKQPKYQVRFLGGEQLRQKILLKSIATKEPAESDQYEIGTRVVAGRPSDTVNTTISKKYKDISSGNNINVMFAGVVAELACEANRNRYLVFFDDGYAQYFTITSLFLVIRPTREVWNDVAIDCRDFIKEYLQEYPYRPLVCTQINSTMQTEWNGEWWKSKVVSIDASLIKMLFDVDKRSEWIYRGTTRLEPLNNHFNPPNPPNKKKKKDKAVGASIGTFIDEKLTHPQYGVSKYSLQDPTGELQREAWNLPAPAGTTGGSKRVPRTQGKVSKVIDEDIPKKLRVQTGMESAISGAEVENPSTISSHALHVTSPANSPSTSLPLLANASKVNEKHSTRSVHLAGKSSSKSPVTPSPVISPTLRGPHACDPTCLKQQSPALVHENTIGVFNYLSVPIKLGWKRESVKKKTGWHRDVYYRTPCNKRLRSIEEVSRYLSVTKCTNVAIDMFCFSSSISCRNQQQRLKPALAKIEDLSGGKETCPIVCVNEINEELPNPIVYISHRMPAEDVMINTDPGFLLCCDCTDNCQDKTKCGCKQLTIESSKAVDGTKDDNAGYQYRRLKETITTGIYECNQNCSCSKERCYNRVVQNGIQLRLQVFNTGNCGWGLRCINDIPKGTFVCTYTGHVLNEQTANKEGMDFGDEYLAELDHIEVVEKAKEDYEEDVPELRSNNITVSSGEDSDSDTSSIMSISSDSEDDTEAGSTTDNADGIPPKKMAKTDEDETVTAKTDVETDPQVDVKADAKLEKAKLKSDSKVGLRSDSKANVKADTEAELTTDSKAELKSDTSAESEVDAKTESKPGMDEDPKVDIKDNLNADASNNILVDSNAEERPAGKDDPEAVSSQESSTEASSGTETESDIGSSVPTTTKPVSNNLPVTPPDTNASQMTNSERIHHLETNPNTSGKQLAIKSTANKRQYGNKNNSNGNNGGRARATRTLYDGDKQMYVIDAKCFGNVGRFLNHSCSPNLFVQNVMVDTHDLRFPWVAFFAQQNIPAYTELTWDYNYEIGSVAGKTLICNCGAKTCKGRLL